MSTTTYRVEGMSCEHCVRAVTAELTKLPGVTAVAVDLDGGEVTVTADPTPDPDAVVAAVEEAGYEVRP